MSRPMIFNVSRGPRRALGTACTIVALGAISPVGALAASHPTTTPKFPVPASARVAPTSTTPATATPTTTTPTPATTTPTPASGAQPGTVAPATTATTPTAANPVFRPTAGSTVATLHRTSPKSTRLSTGALALVVFGALLVLGCLLWGLTRWLALEPRWTVSLMHSLREATYRASATWAEFSDWVRLGH
jgi:hypothetical protein